MTTVCRHDLRAVGKYTDKQDTDGKFAQSRQVKKMELALEVKENLKQYRKKLIVSKSSLEQC